MNTLWQGNVTGVSAAYTAAASDRFIDATATAAFTITLPLLASSQAVIGREITITKVDSSANAVTVACAGTDTFLDATTSKTVSTQWNFLKIRVTKNSAGNKVWRVE